MSKSILLLQSRPEVEVAENEFESVCRIGGINPARIERIDMLQDELVEIDLNQYAAVILGGSPANFANPEDKKSEGQRRFEGWLVELVSRVIGEDKPFLGLCLGVGAIAMARGVQPSFEYGEPVGAVELEFTDEVRSDPLLAGVTPKFQAFSGHKEGIGEVPDSCTLLARTDACVHMLRVGQNVYGTQFHPEIDMEGLRIRLNAYRHHGYFPPEEVDAILSRVAEADLTESAKILKNFAMRYIGTQT